MHLGNGHCDRLRPALPVHLGRRDTQVVALGHHLGGIQVLCRCGRDPQVPAWHHFHFPLSSHCRWACGCDGAQHCGVDSRHRAGHKDGNHWLCGSFTRLHHLFHSFCDSSVKEVFWWKLGKALWRELEVRSGWCKLFWRRPWGPWTCGSWPWSCCSEIFLPLCWLSLVPQL